MAAMNVHDSEPLQKRKVAVLLLYLELCYRRMGNVEHVEYGTRYNNVKLGI